MDRILTRLDQTYDTKFLDNEDKSLVEEVYTHFQTNNQKKVLCKLIDNHKKKKKPQPDFIGGPANLSCHWSEKYNKMIYIFGEKHTNKRNCDVFPASKPLPLGQKKMNIEDFMLELYKTTDCFFDFYFERISAQNTKSERDFNLSEINKKFLGCITYEKRNNTDCKLTRTHYFNSNELEFSYNSKLSFTVSDIINQSVKESEIKDTINIYLKKGPHKTYGIVKEELYNLIQTSNSEKIKEYWRDQIYENIYVNHELSRLDDTIADKIRNYVDIRINNFVDSQLDYWKTLISFLTPTENEIETNPSKYLEKIYYLFKSFYVILQNITDVYMFARMFKVYNLERLPYEGATKYDQPRDSHNIIIYAGDFHSQLYRNFFSYIGFDEIFFSGDKYNRYENKYRNMLTCIDMRNNNEPFFSQYIINKYNDEKRIKKDQEKKKIEDLVQVIPNIKILESILPRLVQTYDTKFLENMEEDLIKELYIYMRQLSKDFTQRKVLFQLIDNHENNKKPQPDFIGGPANLSCHWSEKYNKMIYIFGEKHTNKRNCDVFPASKPLPLGQKKMNIEDFMLELYKTTDCFFDFYFERISAQNTKSERDFNLSEINKKFLGCITYEKRNNTDCKLTRTHYFNSNELEFSYNSKLSFTVSDIINQSVKESEIKDTINIYLKKGPHKTYGIVKEELYNLIQTSNSEKIKEYWRDQIYENIYVNHELSRLDDTIADKIRNYVDIRINNFVDSQLDYWKTLISFLTPTENEIETNPSKYLEKIYYLFKSFYVILQNITDVYMFARMFKVYNLERLPYEGATKYDQPRDSHNIIIYASYERSRLYRDFLNFMDFKMISSTLRDSHYSKSNTCLDMRHFPMPFFSQSAINKYDIDNGLLDDVIMSLKKF